MTMPTSMLFFYGQPTYFEGKYDYHKSPYSVWSFVRYLLFFTFWIPLVVGGALSGE